MEVGSENNRTPRALTVVRRDKHIHIHNTVNTPGMSKVHCADCISPHAQPIVSAIMQICVTGRARPGGARWAEIIRGRPL